MEGVLELHWERDPWGGLHLVAYNRVEGGQLALLGKHDQGPFDGALEAAGWLTRTLLTGNVTPAR